MPAAVWKSSSWGILGSNPARAWRSSSHGCPRFCGACSAHLLLCHESSSPTAAQAFTCRGCGTGRSSQRTQPPCATPASGRLLDLPPLGNPQVVQICFCMRLPSAGSANTSSDILSTVLKDSRQHCPCEDWHVLLRGAHQRALRRRRSVLVVAAPPGGARAGEWGAAEVLRLWPSACACGGQTLIMAMLMFACFGSMRVPVSDGISMTPKNVSVK